MRRPARRIVLLVSAAACGALAAIAGGAPALAGAETAMDKYQALLQEKRGLARENAILKQEAEVAATKDPYIVFDPKERTLEFRVRGRTLKTYAFASVAHDERGRRQADSEAIWRMFKGPITVLEKEGGHPELIPPPPQEAEQTGQLYSDPNQLNAQTGAGPVHSDAGVLGVDAPSEYYIKFEEEVVFHVRTAKSLSFREKASDRLGEIIAGVREAVSGLWGSKDTQRAGEPVLTLYLTTDVDTAKFLHYSLLPGEKLFVAPPPPPPIVLVAAAAR